MSNRTWVCLTCKKSYRRDQTLAAISCALCGENCEYVHWKLHIPSPAKKRKWGVFWTEYLQEKRLIEQFNTNPNLKHVKLKLLHMQLIRR